MQLGIVLDVIIIVGIAFAAWRGVKNGFIRGIVGATAIIVCIMLSGAVAKSFSSEFAAMLRPFVGGVVESKFTEITGLNAGELPSPDADHTENWIIADETLERMGVFKPAAEKIADAVAKEAISLQSDVSGIIADRLAEMIAYVCVFAVAFVLLAIICVVVGNLISLAFTLPGLKQVDAVLGGILGLGRGLLIVLVAATAIRYFGFLASSTIESTTILEYFVLHNPIANLLGI